LGLSEYDLMATEKTVLYSQDFIDTLLWAVPNPTLILDKDFNAIKANNPFYEQFETSVSAIDSYSVYHILADCTDLSKVKEFLDRKEKSDNEVESNNPILIFRDISYLVKVKYLRYDNLSKELIVLVFENITEKQQQQELIRAAKEKIIESEDRFRIIADIQDQKNFVNELEEKVKLRTDELEQSKNFLAMILNSADFGIASYEPIYDDSADIIDFRITYTNADVPQNVGLTIEQVIGKTCKEVYPGIFENGVFDKMKTSILTGLRDTYEVKVPVKNGNMIWLTAAIELVNGSLTITSKNSTAEKEAALNLEKMNKLLNAQNEDLASFTYIASHDLQEPLRKIRMFTSRILEIKDENLTSKALDYFATITATVERMQNLINDLLLYSKMDVEIPKFTRTDLAVIVKQVTASIDGDLDENQVAIKIGQLPIIDAIPTQVRQVFSNIILNAIKYRKKDINTEIEIAAQTDYINDEKFWKISISDNGIGFDIQYKDKIFEVFQRLHGKLEYAGSGIGLAICKKIMKHHQGYITADSILGKGSVFCIYFPYNDRYS